MKNPRIGLLPLYIALYDEAVPKLRNELQPFLDGVAAAFRARQADVAVAPICCVNAEFRQALAAFDANPVDLIVTLHLAYSPSLESAELLAQRQEPILMLDVTPDAAFGRDVDPGRLLYNHGVHGVQDLACMLRRLRKHYEVVAGHLSDPAVMDRALTVVRAATAASALRQCRVLRVGPVFENMGDFQVDEGVLAKVLGLRADTIAPLALARDVEAVTATEVEAERQADLQAFAADLDVDVHRRSLRLGLGLRRYLERGHYTALSMNFLAFDQGEGPVCTVPFLECSKAMARGLGYAGEGDVLTAGLVAALNTGFGPTSFTEIFCPDWAGGTLFLSHMGEFNPLLAAGKPRLYEKPFPFTPAQNPACLALAPEPGPATFTNLAPGPDDTFRLIMAPVEILGDGTHPDAKQWIRAWIKPRGRVETFLEEYSRLGGTHHCAILPGDHTAGLLAFARLAGIEGVLLDAGL